MLIELRLEDKERMRRIINRSDISTVDILLDERLYRKLLESRELGRGLLEKISTIRENLIREEGTQIRDDVIDRYMTMVESGNILKNDFISSIAEKINGEYLVYGGTSLLVFNLDPREKEELLKYPIKRVDKLDRMVRERINSVNKRIMYRDYTHSSIRIKRNTIVDFDFDRLTATIKGNAFTYKGSISSLTRNGILVLITEAEVRDTFNTRYTLEDFFILDFDRDFFYIPRPSRIGKEFNIKGYYIDPVSKEGRIYSYLLIHGYNIDEAFIDSVDSYVIRASKRVKYKDLDVTVRVLVSKRENHSLEIRIRGIENLKGVDKSFNEIRDGDTITLSLEKKEFTPQILLHVDTIITHLLHRKGYLDNQKIEGLLDKARVLVVYNLLSGKNKKYKTRIEDPVLPLIYLSLFDRTGEIIEAVREGKIISKPRIVTPNPEDIIYFPSDPDLIVAGKRISSILGRTKTDELLIDIFRSGSKLMLNYFSKASILKREWLRRGVLDYESDPTVLLFTLEKLDDSELIRFIKNRKDIVLSSKFSFIADKGTITNRITCISDESMYCGPLLYLSLRKHERKRIGIGYLRGRYYLYILDNPKEKFFVLRYNGRQVLVSLDWSGREHISMSVGELLEGNTMKKRLAINRKNIKV